MLEESVPVNVNVLDAVNVLPSAIVNVELVSGARSEERRVGKEC